MEQKCLTDMHTHTAFSIDGQEDIFAMLQKAEALGVKYWGICEHFDYDYYVNGITFGGEPVGYTDAKAYFITARKLQTISKEVKIAVGGELGFTVNSEAQKYYQALIDAYKPDYIVNSVHTNGMADYYEERAFAGKSKGHAYEEYLLLVRKSLDAPYPYDIVGHLGYCARCAPYADKRMRYAEFADILDDILKTVIAKGKILEVNSAVKGLPTSALPFRDILQRYYELGGRKISYGSDAHGGDRLLEGRQTIVSQLKEIGFTYLTLPMQGKHTEVEL